MMIINGEDLQRERMVLDKTLEIGTLNTNYSETKYQSVSLQTLAFYLINSLDAERILGSNPDIKTFGEKPLLESIASTKFFVGLTELSSENLDSFKKFFHSSMIK